MARVQRRFSFTDRISIAESSVSARTFITGDGEVGLQIDAIDFPAGAERSRNKAVWPSARVICKARDRRTDSYYNEDIGSVAEVLARSNGVHTAILPGFRSLAGIKLSIRVIDPQTKRLITSIDDFSADNDNDQDREELFEVVPEDIGEEVWKVDWTGDSPILVVDTQIAEEMLKSPLFAACVLPNAFREVLAKAAAGFDNDDGPGWESKFVRFAEMLSGPRPDEPEADSPAVAGWIEKSVAAFAKKNAFKSKLLNQIAIERNDHAA